MTMKIIRGTAVVFECKRTIPGEERHTRRLSALTRTWFANSRFVLLKILKFYFLFADDTVKYEMLIKDLTGRDGKKVSSETIADWSSYAREVMLDWVLTNQAEEGPLGGKNVEVEIDEAKIGKRKYNRGRQIDGTCVIGLIEIDPRDGTGSCRGGRYRIFLLPDNARNAETLIPLSRENVARLSTICTYQWAAYNQLGHLPENYTHFTVNHTHNFVDPATGANTQTIESNWRATKAGLGSWFRKQYLYLHLAEFLYRRSVKRAGVDPVLHFFQAVRDVFPGL